MNTNIVNYIIKNKKLTQSQIAEKISVSQVAVSKWKRGDNIPNEREIELLKMADICWRVRSDLTNPDTWDSKDVFDSKWNVLVQSEKNQNGWYYFFSELFSPNAYLSEGGLSLNKNNSDFMDFVREGLLLLNDLGFPVTSNPEHIKESGIYAEAYDSEFFEFLLLWTKEITILQQWHSISVSPYEHLTQDDFYDKLPEIALARTLLNSGSDDTLYPFLSVPILEISTVESFIEDTKAWLGNYVNIKDYTYQMGYIYDEILIDNDKSSTDNAIKPRLENVQENSHWSEAERKIYEGIKNNEKLLKELLEKLNKQEKE
jgi:transcriptional regulator with XRE-family HTH domain